MGTGSFALVYLAIGIAGAVYVGYCLRGLNSADEKKVFGSQLGIQFGSLVAVMGLGGATFWGYQWLAH